MLKDSDDKQPVHASINDRNQTRIDRLLLTAREAARILSISERTLFTWTKRGEIQCVRIGRAVRYDPTDLKRWIQKRKSAADA